MNADKIKTEVGWEITFAPIQGAAVTINYSQ
jgi:hypothetical protein